ncbi:hypothetical protein BY996DRAFT_6560422 [Phakopsora pachyrhizi]|nr:hypothetical protein BY996DRAFT_6560422 [Phakopsora pachyrhizi]
MPGGKDGNGHTRLCLFVQVGQAQLGPGPARAVGQAWLGPGQVMMGAGRAGTAWLGLGQARAGRGYGRLGLVQGRLGQAKVVAGRAGAAWLGIGQARAGTAWLGIGQARAGTAWLGIGQARAGLAWLGIGQARAGLAKGRLGQAWSKAGYGRQRWGQARAGTAWLGIGQARAGKGGGRLGLRQAMAGTARLGQAWSKAGNGRQRLRWGQSRAGLGRLRWGQAWLRWGQARSKVVAGRAGTAWLSRYGRAGRGLALKGWAGAGGGLVRQGWVQWQVGAWLGPGAGQELPACMRLAYMPSSTVFDIIQRFHVRGGFEEGVKTGRPRSLSERDLRELGRVHQLPIQLLRMCPNQLSVANSTKWGSNRKEHVHWTFEKWSKVMWTNEASVELGKNSFQIKRKVDGGLPTAYPLCWESDHNGLGAFIGGHRSPLVIMPKGERTAADFDLNPPFPMKTSSSWRMVPLSIKLKQPKYDAKKTLPRASGSMGINSGGGFVSLHPIYAR